MSTFKFQLKNHVTAIHKKERNFSCTDCQFITHVNSSLKRHVLALHENKKPFSCNKCSYCTPYSFQLKAHAEALHTSERNFNCSKCNFKTYNKQVLRNASWLFIIKSHNMHYDYGTNTNGEILCIIIGLMYLCTSLFGKEGFGLGKWGQLYTRW